MRKMTIRNTGGSLQVSANVISHIAENAALEVDGVARIHPISAKKNLFSGKVYKKENVFVELSEGVAAVQIAVLLYPEAKADVVGQNIQRSIKQAIQSMTGIAVTEVDVTIVDVAFTND